MALRLAFSPSHSTLSGQAPASFLGSQSCCPSLAFRCSRNEKDVFLMNESSLISGFCLAQKTHGKGRSASFVARAVEQAAATSVGVVTEVTQETFWPIVEAAGEKIVVLDMYTQWCGPCKIMYPKILDLTAKYTDVVFLKLDCNQENKALAKTLGVRVVPTFKIFKNRVVVAEVKGAKFDELVQSIEKVRAG